MSFLLRIDFCRIKKYIKVMGKLTKQQLEKELDDLKEFALEEVRAQAGKVSFNPDALMYKYRTLSDADLVMLGMSLDVNEPDPNLGRGIDGD